MKRREKKGGDTKRKSGREREGILTHGGNKS